MRPIDIDRSDDVWVYRPPKHKGAWRGQVRSVVLGPLAQKILAPFLSRPADQYCFSPGESEAWRRANHAGP